MLESSPYPAPGGGGIAPSDHNQQNQPGPPMRGSGVAGWGGHRDVRQCRIPPPRRGGDRPGASALSAANPAFMEVYFFNFPGRDFASLIPGQPCPPLQTPPGHFCALRGRYFWRPSRGVGGTEQPWVCFLLPRLLQDDIFNVLMAEGKAGGGVLQNARGWGGRGRLLSP